MNSFILHIYVFFTNNNFKKILKGKYTLKNNILSKIVSFFSYNPTQSYSFSLPETPDENIKNGNTPETSAIPSENSKENGSKKIFESLDVNLEFLKVKYNTLINSDIVIREFNVTIKGKEYKAFLIYIDGMIDSKMINDFILKPLMLNSGSRLQNKNDDKAISVAIASNISVKRVKKINLSDYIYNCLIPQNTITKKTEFCEIISDINSGNCGLFIDTLNTAFSIEVKGFKSRAVSEPNNEVVVHRLSRSIR